MKKTIFNIFIAVLVGIVFYFLSVNFVFKIPSPIGGYEAITYQVGCGVAVVAGLITAILLFVFNRDKKK
ncbi:MAG: hypothetical protein ACI4DY_14490 [Monoglobaceae bacterium]